MQVATTTPQSSKRLTTSDRLGSSLYSLVVDPTENTVSSNPSVVVMGGCLAIDWIIFFLRERVSLPLSSNECSFSLSLHSNGYTRYNILFSPNCWPKMCGPYLSESSWGRPPLRQVSFVSVLRSIRNGSQVQSFYCRIIKQTCWFK
jgi:hypothetical protein